MADSTLSERSSISRSDYSDFEASMNMMKGFMNLLRKSRPWQFEPPGRT